MFWKRASLPVLLGGLFLARVHLGAVDYLTEIKPVLRDQCTGCHAARQHKAGLRLDSAAWALKGGDTGPAIKPSHPEESLLVQVLEGTHPDIQRMPLKKAPLSAATIEKIKAWIQSGAVAPADEKEEEAVHWAFTAPKVQAPPSVSNAAWVKNPIDQFILSKLEAVKAAPSPEAGRRTLIRRASLDLIGLPPTPRETEAFVADSRPDAYERLIDRLLSSPHFGERWGRVWLDVARYADSNGYSIDAPRSIWRYRDWVIEAINSNMPFDEFTIEQIAGDMLPNASFPQIAATGFHRNTMINEEGGIDKEQFRIESVLDRVNTTAGAFLGVTFGCAQCHDHKFDPFTQKDYYQFFAFFNNADEPTVDVADRRVAFNKAKHDEELREAEANLKKFLASLSQEEAAWEESLLKAPALGTKPELIEIAKLPREKRKEKQNLLMTDNFLVNNPEYKERKGRIAALKKETGKAPTTLVMAERKAPRESYLFVKGDFTRHGQTVTPATPAILPPIKGKTGLNRLDLARWLVSQENPLTARVTVNRIWQQYFGKGIVETENDFGSQGSGPSHQELLDWLACEFMRSGWDVKAMHKLIATSATYRQSSSARPDLALIDPNNRLLARQARIRLDAELIRDAALRSSGMLVETVGGPSVFPPQPDGVMTLGQSKREWKASQGPDRYRRGLYTFIWRATPHPDLVVFDAPDGTSACTRRIRSNTPLQSLTLLNDSGYYELAQALGERTVREGGADDGARIDYAFQLCLARPPRTEEKERLLRLVNEFSDKKVAWNTLGRVLLNLDETITRE